MTLVARYLRGFDGLPRSAWLLAAVLLVNTSGTMVVFFLPLYLTEALHWPTSLAGTTMSVYGVGTLFGTICGGLLSDRLGAFKVQRLSLVGTGTILVVLSFLGWAPITLVTIAVWGACASALWPANATAMAAVCLPDVRARGFVLNRLAGNLGVTIGPLVGGFLARHDYRLLFWVDGTTCLLAAAAAWWFFPTNRPAPLVHASPETTTPSARWWDDRVFLALLSATFVFGLVFSQIFSTYSLYLKQVAGLIESRIGPLFAVNTGLIVLLQMQLTHGTERFSRTRLAALGALLLGAGLASIPLAGGNVFALAATVVVWTFGEMLTLPLFTTMVSLRASAGSQGRYQGLWTMSYSLGVTFGPMAGTWIYVTKGPATLWTAVGLVSVSLAIALVGLSTHWDGKRA
jgi:predicted MFS family arabinose efflux permease